MNFLVWMANHSPVGQRSLEDVVGIMGHQMRALGHNIIWDPKNDMFYNGEHGINIIVEGFTNQSIEVIANAYYNGARFVCLATEEPTPRGFNYGTQREMVWRQEKFPLAAKFFEGIICLVPGDHVVNWYGQFAPAAYTELGYAPSLIRANDIEPTYDFGFYGSLTHRRHSILKRLAKRIGSIKAVRVVADFTTQTERDQQMREAKVIVQVRKFERMGLVSSSRCNTALCLGRPVIAEPHDLSKPWDEIVDFSETMEDFYNRAIMVRAAWKNVHAAQFAKFKSKLPPEVCIGAALDKIKLSASPPPRKAFAA